LLALYRLKCQNSYSGPGIPRSSGPGPRDRAIRFRDDGGTHSIVRMTGNITKGGCDNPDCTCENCNCGSGCTCGKD